jgi:hypothetical protein
MFGVKTIPKDTQMRDSLDTISSEQFYPIFSDYFRKLQRAGQLKSFSVLDGKYLISMDGTQYFAFNSISCPWCLKKYAEKTKRSNIPIRSWVLPFIVNPDKRHVIALAPEPIQNHDGTDKQDCEINAGKSLIKGFVKTIQNLKSLLTPTVFIPSSLSSSSSSKPVCHTF